MLDDLLIFNESGALLFNWHPEGREDSGKDDLLSGFLTAINSFATYERGEDIKSLRLKETNILFERYDNLIQKLTFVVTTKNAELTELLHSFIHEVVDQFVLEFKTNLNKEFDGEITKYKRFKENINQIRYSLGLDILTKNVKEIEQESDLKSVIYIEPKSGNILYIYAKHYIDKEKVSFLIPLVLNSARLLYQNYIDEHLKWFLLNSVQGESIVVEPRKNIAIVKQFQLPSNIKDDFLSLEFFKDEEKYVKKSNKIIEKFENIKWESEKAFTIESVNCSTAQVRSVMTKEELTNTVCPWAIFAASVVNKVIGKELRMEPSEYNEIGAITTLMILD